MGKRTAVDAIPLEKYVNEAVGLPTLRDIAAELIKPGRDPREDGIRLTYSDDVSEIDDLRPGMVLQGTVTNVTNFGAFVDIGVHQDGLIHISELSDQFVTDPSSVVAVGDVLSVRILDADKIKKRISLSAKSQSRAGAAGGSATTRPAQPAMAAATRGAPAKAAPKVPEKSHNMTDLLSKFGRK